MSISDAKIAFWLLDITSVLSTDWNSNKNALNYLQTFTPSGFELSTEIQAPSLLNTCTPV